MSLSKIDIRATILLTTAILSISGKVQSDDSIHPTAQDVAAMSTASGVGISPDGKTVVYSLETYTFDSTAVYDPEDDEGGWTTRRRLWLVNTDKAVSRLLTSGECDRDPVWSPDGGTIAFIRETDDSTGLYVIAIDGGEAVPVDVGNLMPENPQYSPDGAWLAFTAEVRMSQDEKEAKWRTGGVEVFDQEWRPWSIWTVVIDGGQLRRVTSEPEHIAEYCWSPEGTRLAALTKSSSDPYVVARDATPRIYSLGGSPSVDLEPEGMMVECIRWSPDGKYIGCVFAERGLSVCDQLRLYSLKDATASNLMKQQDWTITNFVWTADSRSLLVQTIDRTVSGLYEVSLSGEVKSQIDLDRRAVHGNLSLDSKARSATCQFSQTKQPNFIGKLDIPSGQVSSLVSVDPRTSDWTLSEAEIVSWVNPEGAEIEGLLFVAPLAKPGVIPPMMIMPHGGPDGVTMEKFDSWIHFFGAHGYSVFRPNYRGGIGYGFDFYEANRGRLGEIEWIDIESGVDHLISSGKADPDKLVYGGWSWGGYVTAWTIGHTDRYKAAVIGAGVGDVRSQYVTSDINHGVAAQWEFNGNPWEQPENFEKANPARFFANATTPTLVAHGKADERVTFMQGITVYRALCDAGCKVRFLAYPDEPHWPFTPVHHAHLIDAWVEWYDAHLND